MSSLVTLWRAHFLIRLIGRLRHNLLSHLGIRACGQGISLIKEITSTAELVARVRSKEAEAKGKLMSLETGLMTEKGCLG